MSDPGSLAALIDQFENIQAALRAATGRTDHERKLEIVNLRRALAMVVGRLSDAAGREQWFRASPAAAAEFRARISAMRSALALHQSQWPAVTLDDVTPAYRVSTDAVRAASEHFIGWTKAQLSAPLQEG